MAAKSTNLKLALRMSNFIFRILVNCAFYLLIIFLITKASREIYQFSYQIFGQVRAEEAPGRDAQVQIRKGESTMNVASKLQLNKFIVNKYSFYVKAKLLDHKIMPGTYIINTSMSYDEIFAIITVPNTDEVDEDKAKESDKEKEESETKGAEVDEKEKDTP